MFLWILRASYLLVTAGVAFYLTKSSQVDPPPTFLFFCIVLGIAGLVILGDVLIQRKRIEFITSVFTGMIVGILLTYFVRVAIDPLVSTMYSEMPDQGKHVLDLILLPIGIGACYVCISLLLQTRDDFRFIIPYVEFSKEVKGLKPYLLDTSVIIDGRIADLVETGALDNQLIMPRFILNELQGIADSSDKLRRSRGRRGLDIVNRLRTQKGVELRIYEREVKEMAGQPVDMKLILLAKFLEGKVVTGDYNLNKVAKIHNVPVINLNDIANSLKPVFLPGEHVDVSVVKPGEEANQGVGYLDDGTMIVIEDGRAHVGQTIQIVVTSVLQTSAGRMIFGRYEKGGKPSR